jgi:uncharacterized OB-fold protein
VPLVAASVVVPRLSSGGRRREEPDEDGFTLGVEAAERLETLLPGAAPPARIHWFGALPSETVGTVGVALGAPRAAVAHTPGGADELRALLGPSDGSPALLVAVEGLRELDVPGRGERDSGAVALRWEPEGSAPAPAGNGIADVRPYRLGAPGSALAVAADLAGMVPGALYAPLPSEVAWSPAHPPPAPSLSGVSEGAYVPRPRYLENLPARWRFAAELCPAGHVTFPPRGSCRSCGASEGLRGVELPRDGGRVEAVTRVHPGAQPTEFDWRVDLLGGYEVALVRIHPEARVTLQVADTPAGAVRPGDVVGTRLRRLYAMEGAWRYGRKAIPTGRR